MALRKQFDLETLSDERQNLTSDYEGVEVLRKLPPDTLPIKQDARYKEDSDYVRDSTETSSGSSSTSGGGPGKVKRIHRAVRKSRGTVEIRRNPMRVTKKDTDKDFSHSRQRLLSAKRRECPLNAECVKRAKSGTMPYMNTRSVTRKLYNVGATYQAPTIRDETEWKEWPVHGMHERPVFHPQVGLAVEYLGKYFASLDGLSYRELVDPSEIEVVSVDPHSEFPPTSCERKQNKKVRSGRDASDDKRATKRSNLTEKSESFEACMHESFHCVLGYCSQIMTPTYKINVEEKLNKLNLDESATRGFGKELKLETESKQIPINVTNRFKDDLSVDARDSPSVCVERNKLLDNHVTPASQDIRSFGLIGKSNLFPAQKMYFANSQKSVAFSSPKTLQGRQMNIQELVLTSKNPLILVNASDAKSVRARVARATSADGNIIKLEDSGISDEALMEMSSMYKNLDPGDEIGGSSERLSSNTTPTKRGNKVEFTLAKYLLDNSQGKNHIAKESAGKEPRQEIPSKEASIKMQGGSNKPWCASEASEIAKILSEYNKSSAKKPAIENHDFCTALNNTTSKEPIICKKDQIAIPGPSNNSAERNVNIKFPQGKWRRFHLTLEKLKGLKTNNEKRLLTGMNRKQFRTKDEQVAGDSSARVSTTKENEVTRSSELLGQSWKMKFEASKTMTNAGESKRQCLRDLLENTAVLYCAATGTHHDDLANYIDTLDATQSGQWLETCNNSIM